MDALIRLIASSVLRGSVYRLLRRRSASVVIAIASIALIAYVMVQS